MKKLLIALGLLMLPLAYAGFTLWLEMSRIADDNPLVWEPIIAAWEAEQQTAPPPQDAVLFVGSSSIRMWDTLAADMAPLPVIQRGFGGARMGDVRHYADRIVLPYQARAVVFFVGSNDINVAASPAEAMAAVPIIATGFQSLVNRILRERPSTTIFWIDITATPSAWDNMRAIDEANREVLKICNSRSRVHCVHTRDAFINGEGKPDDSLFILDGLHLNEAGYALWTSMIKPRLLTALATSS
ncbi:MAG: GDSL-type esterase/lipase family protein [Halieaceae bacterium]